MTSGLVQIPFHAAGSESVVLHRVRMMQQEQFQAGKRSIAFVFIKAGMRPARGFLQLLQGHMRLLQGSYLDRSLPENVAGNRGTGTWGG